MSAYYMLVCYVSSLASPSHFHNRLCGGLADNPTMGAIPTDLMDLMDLWTPQSRQSLEKMVGLGWFHSFKMLKSILDRLQFAKVNQEVLMFDRF